MTGFKRILSIAAVALALACNDSELVTTEPGGEDLGPAFSIGVGTSGETIATDKDDYSPGDTVTITGGGWELGETVRLVLTESPSAHGPREWDVEADPTGNLLDRSFVIEEHHFKVTFTLTASGVLSGRTAQTIFTDGTFFWRGCANSDWHNTANWASSSGTTCPVSGTPVGIPDDGSDDAIIQNVINDPVISANAVAKKITINSGGHLTVSANLALNDGVDVNGTWTHTAGTVSFTASGKKMTIGASAAASYNQSGGTFGSLATNTPDFLIESNGTAVQSGGAFNVNILEIKTGRTFSQSNAGSIVALKKDWKNEGTFSSTGGKVNFASGALWASPNTAANQFFDVELDAGLTLNAQTVQVAGNWLNDVSNLNTSNSHTIVFNGAADQTIGGTQNTTFRNLQVNKSGGNLNLARDQTVQNTLTFTLGNIVTGAQTITVAAGGTVSRASGHVVGNLRKAINSTGAVARTYEVGTGPNYTPIIVNIATVAGAGAAQFLTGSSTAGDHPNLGSSDINPAKSANRHWSLIKTGTWTFANYDATFNFVAGDLDAGANTAEFVVRKFDAAWSSPPGGSTTAATSTTGNDLTSFSSYAVGSTVPSDGTAPDVAIEQAAGQADPTGSSPILFTAVFSEDVTGFAGTDVSFTGSSVGGSLSATVTGGPAIYNVAVSGMTGTGSVVASIPAGAATDGAGNTSTASPGTGDNTVAFDGTAPTVTVNKASGQADPTSASPIEFTVVFSETVSDFDNGDVTLGGTAGATTALMTGSGATYTVAVSGMTSDGSVTASLAQNVAHDAVGNGNTLSTSTDNNVAFVAAATKLAITTAAHTGLVGQCLGQITVQAQNASSAPRNVASDLTVGLGSDNGTTGAGGFYSDNACANGVTSVVIEAGSNSESFYYKATGRGDGSHEVTATATGLTSASQTQTVNKADQTVAFTSTEPSNAVFGGNYSVSASATSGLAVSITSQTTAVCTVSGTVSFVGVGTCTLAANQAGNGDYNAAPPVSQAFEVGKAPATITLSNLSQVYNGSPKSATATTTPAGLTAVTITYDGATAPPTDAGSYAVVASLDNANYEASDAQGTLVIDQAPQSITFTSTAPTNPIIGGTYTVSATATSGLAVAFSSLTPGVCTVSASSVSFIGIGTCTVAADQAGNNNYEAAPQVTQGVGTVKYTFLGFFAPVDQLPTLNISKAGQAIPLKWRLLDAGGNPITNLAAVSVQASNLACGLASTTDLMEEYASGSSGLQNLGDGYYQFNWKTPPSYANSCKSIKLVFGTGALGYTEGPHAYFSFKK